MSAEPIPAAPAAADPTPLKPVPKGLVMKLAEVMGAIDRIPKNGKNEHFGYRFATEADVADAVRGELAKRHVLAMPCIESVQWGEVPRRSGGVEKLCTLKAHYDFIDGETGEVLSMPMLGQGTDASDKAIYKALTGAVKQALLKLFLISTGDDPEHEPKHPQPKQTPPSPSSARPPQRAAKPNTPTPRPQTAPTPTEAAPGEAPRTAKFARPGEPGGPQAAEKPSTPASAGDYDAAGAPVSARAKAAVQFGECQSPADVKAVVAHVKTLSAAEQDFLRPMYLETMGRISAAGGKAARGRP